MDQDLFYYRNRSGLIAVSFDQGDTIILPSGKLMDHTEFWEDVSEDLRAELTPQQEATLARNVEKEDKTEMGQIIRRYKQRRKLQERLDGQEPEPVYRTLSDDVKVVVADFD